MTGAERDPGSARRRLALRIGLPLAVLAVGAVALMALGRDNSATAQQESTTTDIATIERRTLVESESLSGTLGYGDQRAATASLSGALTWIAGEGAIRTRDQILFMVDESPVLLLYGTVPAYRDMAQGDQGRDVLQLERNLAALGFDADDGLTVDGYFDSATHTAVSDWQESHGLEETGTVEQGRVVFLPGERRVSAVTATVGSRSGGAVMSTTSSQRTVAVDLDARRQELLSLGDTVSVELPDESTAEARVASVSRVAESAGESSAPTIAVVLTVAGAASRDLPDAAPVTVNVQTDAAENVLSAPVNALLALAGGGYGLERVDDGGTTTVVSAQVGTIADGMAEVSGPNVTEGMRVAVPA